MNTLFELASDHNIITLDTTLPPLFTQRIVLVDPYGQPFAAKAGAGIANPNHSHRDRGICGCGYPSRLGRRGLRYVLPDLYRGCTPHSHVVGAPCAKALVERRSLLSSDRVGWWCRADDCCAQREHSLHGVPECENARWIDVNV